MEAVGVVRGTAAVRTKMRTLDQRVLLEACIENATSRPLQLAQVKFETAPGVRAAPIQHSASLSRDVHDLEHPDRWLDSYADSLQVCSCIPAVVPRVPDTSVWQADEDFTH